MKSICTLLFIAALSTLLSACGNPGTENHQTADSNDDMLEVAERGDLAAIEQLLARRHQPDVRDSCDWTPLMKAALNGHLPVVERLLASGASIDAKDKGGYTAMMLAASNNHAEVVDLLLRRGAMVDHQEDTQGWSALIWAAKQGHLRTVETLLRHDADRTLKDFSGKTAADWSSEAGYAEILRQLRATDQTGH
jgi:uncharacterized protein